MAKRKPKRREFDPLSVLDTAPVSFDELVGRLTVEELRDLVQYADTLLQRLAWKAGYLEARYGCGCGDQGHDAAVKNANKWLRGVRKAIGYSLPDAAAIHV